MTNEIPAWTWPNESEPLPETDPPAVLTVVEPDQILVPTDRPHVKDQPTPTQVPGWPDLDGYERIYPLR